MKKCIILILQWFNKIIFLYIFNYSPVSSNNVIIKNLVNLDYNENLKSY